MSGRSVASGSSWAPQHGRRQNRSPRSRVVWIPRWCGGGGTCVDSNRHIVERRHHVRARKSNDLDRTTELIVTQLQVLYRYVNFPLRFVRLGIPRTHVGLDVGQSSRQLVKRTLHQLDAGVQ